LVGRVIDLVAHLETPEQIDELIRKLQFGKLMITPAKDIKPPKDDDGK
jgi:hypothetical protein